jgi:hypothetical protein
VNQKLPPIRDLEPSAEQLQAYLSPELKMTYECDLELLNGKDPWFLSDQGIEVVLQTAMDATSARKRDSFSSGGIKGVGPGWSLNTEQAEALHEIALIRDFACEYMSRIQGAKSETERQTLLAEQTERFESTRWMLYLGAEMARQRLRAFRNRQNAANPHEETPDWRAIADELTQMARKGRLSLTDCARALGKRYGRDYKTVLNETKRWRE